MKIKFQNIFYLLLALIATACACASGNNELQKEIAQIIHAKQATVGVAVIHEKDTILVNNEKHYPMQSVYKFHLALAVLHEVDKGNLSLEQPVFITKEELLPDTYSPLREKYPEGNVEVPLKEILQYTVSQSDNNGCDILFRLVGGTNNVQHYIRNTGIENSNIVATEAEMHRNWDTQFSNWSTPLATALLLEKFYRRELLSDSSYTFLWNTMAETSTGAKRLKGLLPVGTTVAHKTGSGPTQDGITSACNDAGIVQLPDDSHFSIVVFITNSKETSEDNERIIAEITKACWNYFCK